MLALTEQRLAAVYDCLRKFPPFCRYGLPDSSGINFGFIKKNDRAADYTSYIYDLDSHFIRLNPNWAGHFDTVASYMAHEMIHAHQRTKRLETSGTEHNADFKRKAKVICDRFGWDFKRFV
jgi:hypothetical protein